MKSLPLRKNGTWMCLRFSFLNQVLPVEKKFEWIPISIVTYRCTFEQSILSSSPPWSHVSRTNATLTCTMRLLRPVQNRSSMRRNRCVDSTRSRRKERGCDRSSNLRNNVRKISRYSIM